jgi:hypothetical protein
MCHNVTFRRVRATTVALEKQYCIFRVCVLLALGIRHAMRTRHIAVCGLTGFTLFFHIISQTVSRGSTGLELAFALAKNATKPNPFKIILLQTTTKKNNWKTEVT